MADVQHAALTGAELHECKGASSATAGQVPVANGSGSAPFGVLVNGSLITGQPVQVVYGSTTTYTTISTAIPADDTVPQNTEGTEIMTVTITPKSTTNKLLIRAIANVAGSDNIETCMALFKDSDASAIACAYLGTVNVLSYSMVLEHQITAGTTSAQTFKIRVGPESGTCYVNGGGTGRRYGGVLVSSISITEFKAS